MENYGYTKNNEDKSRHMDFNGIIIKILYINTCYEIIKIA
jgi:hypothetical protein